VMGHLADLDPSFPDWSPLKDMTEEVYLYLQDAAQKIADRQGVLRIRFEDAWSSEP